MSLCSLIDFYITFLSRILKFKFHIYIIKNRKDEHVQSLNIKKNLKEKVDVMLPFEVI
jgi:hypothetical protein